MKKLRILVIFAVSVTANWVLGADQVDQEVAAFAQRLGLTGSQVAGIGPLTANRSKVREHARNRRAADFCEERARVARGIFFGVDPASASKAISLKDTQAAEEAMSQYRLLCEAFSRIGKSCYGRILWEGYGPEYILNLFKRKYLGTPEQCEAHDANLLRLLVSAETNLTKQSRAKSKALRRRRVRSGGQGNSDITQLLKLKKIVVEMKKALL